MPRIPFVTPAAVSESERAAYDAFVQKRGSRPNAGPYALLLQWTLRANCSGTARSVRRRSIGRVPASDAAGL